MFQKLDNYLQKIDDPASTFSEKMMSFKNGMIRLKKIKKQINAISQDLEAEMRNKNGNDLVLGNDFDWVTCGEEIQTRFNRGEDHSQELEVQLSEFLETRKLIQQMEKYLETQHFEIKKICDDYEELHLEDITRSILKIQNANDSEVGDALDHGTQTETKTENVENSETSTESEYSEQSTSSEEMV